MKWGFIKFELDKISQKTIRFAARLFDTLEYMLCEYNMFQELEILGLKLLEKKFTAIR